eukprot:scaffold577_cov405-Prasinococcus_capsulatus_cf.AAC.9
MSVDDAGQGCTAAHPSNAPAARSASRAAADRAEAVATVSLPARQARVQVRVRVGRELSSGARSAVVRAAEQGAQVRTRLRGGGRGSWCCDPCAPVMTAKATSKKRRSLHLPKGLQVDSWPAYRKLLSGSLLQPKSFHYGGMGVAKPSVYLDLADKEFRKKFKTIWQEHVEGCSDGKGYAKRKSRESNMLWRQRLQAKQLERLEAELQHQQHDESCEREEPKSPPASSASGTAAGRQGRKAKSKRRVSEEHQGAAAPAVAQRHSEGNVAQAPRRIGGSADKVKQREAARAAYEAMSTAAAKSVQSYTRKQGQPHLQIATGRRGGARAPSRGQHFSFHL